MLAVSVARGRKARRNAAVQAQARALTAAAVSPTSASAAAVALGSASPSKQEQMDAFLDRLKGPSGGGGGGSVPRNVFGDEVETDEMMTAELYAHQRQVQPTLSP